VDAIGNILDFFEYGGSMNEKFSLSLRDSRTINVRDKLRSWQSQCCHSEANRPCLNEFIASVL